MKKFAVLLCCAVLLVGCNNKGNEKANGVEVEAIAPEDRALITVNDAEVSIGAFEKYYAMQSYDFEKEYGEGVWAIEKDGKTMAEIRQDQTIDYLVRVQLIKDYILQKGAVIDEKIIDEGYEKYMLSIADDDAIALYYQENGLDEAFLRQFLKDQYYLKKFGELIFEDVSKDEATLETLFKDKVIRYKARHILLEDPVKVSEVLSLLNAEEDPADFSDMARLYSNHSTSAVKGGDLGYALIGSMPQVFEEVVLSIEQYTVSESIETEYGYHIIFVDDRQMLSDMLELGMPEEEMETYKNEIIRRYSEDKTLSVFNDLRSSALVDLDEDLLNEE